MDTGELDSTNGEDAKFAEKVSVIMILWMVSKMHDNNYVDNVDCFDN